MITAAHDSVSVSTTQREHRRHRDRRRDHRRDDVEPADVDAPTTSGMSDGCRGDDRSERDEQSRRDDDPGRDRVDPTATTGPPATCDGPEDCTGEGQGELTTFVLPFFRGEVCTADTLRPGDMLPISWNPCVHPCIDPQKYGWRYLVRCDGGVGCEIAFIQYYREATGSNCPSDVFAKFNPEGCKYIGPHIGLSEGLKSFGYPDDQLVVPFLTNDDATAISMGEPSAEVWARIDGHTQSADRYFPLSVSDQNPAPPEKCGPGVAGLHVQAGRVLRPH